MKKGFLTLFLTLGVLSIPVFGQGGFHDRVTKRRADAEKAEKSKPVAGAMSFTVEKAYQETFDLVVNQLKKEGFTIEDANTVTGQIATPIEESKGGYSQKGTRVSVSLIKESAAATTVKVVVAEFSRKKLFAAEPWSNPKPDNEKTKELAELFKTALSK